MDDYILHAQVRTSSTGQEESRYHGMGISWSDNNPAHAALMPYLIGDKQPRSQAMTILSYYPMQETSSNIISEQY